MASSVYRTSPTGTYRLTRDGREVIIGTEQEIYTWIHSHHAYSVDHALQHEGYAIQPYDVNTQQEA